MLDGVLHAMEEDLRAVFVLFELEEMPTAEIATLLAIPPGTVASRLRRAREEFEVQVARIKKRRGGGLVTEPKRLSHGDDLGAALLASARGDEPRAGSRARTAAAIGLGLGVVRRRRSARRGGRSRQGGGGREHRAEGDLVRAVQAPRWRRRSG